MLFIMSGFWAAVLFLIFVFWMLFLVNYENATAATILTLVALAIFQVGGVIDLHYISVRPLNALEWAVGYLLIGLVWAVLRWYFFIGAWARGIHKEIDLYRAEFLRENDVRGEVIPDHLVAAWKEKMAKTPSLQRMMMVPKVVDHKSRLVVWAVYWPFSMVWTMIDDPLRRFYEYILTDVFGKTLQNIANKKAAEVRSIIE